MKSILILFLSCGNKEFYKVFNKDNIFPGRLTGGIKLENNTISTKQTSEKCKGYEQDLEICF